MAIRALTGVQQASSSSSSPSSSSSSSPGSLVCAPTLFSPTSSSITFSTPSPISPSAQPTDNTPPPPPLPGSSGVDQVAGVSRRLDFQSAGSGRSGSVAGIRAGEGALSSAIVPPGGTSSLHSSSSSYFSTTSGGVASTSAKLASIHLSPTSPPSVASARYQTTAGTSRPNCPHSGAGDGSAKATTREGGCDCESSTSSGRSTSASRSQTLGSALDAAHNLVGGRSGSSSLAMAEGLASLLGPIVREFDANAQSAMRSQERLTVNIGRLTAELDKLLEDTPIPHVSQHAAKLAGIRKRVVALTSTLRLIQARIGSMNSILNKKARLARRSVPRGGVSRHSFNSSSSSRTTAVGKASLTSTPIPMQQRATGSTPAHGHHRARSLDEVFSVGSHDDEFWTITMSDDEHADGRRAGDHQHAVQLEKKKRGPDKLLLNRSHGKGMSEQSKGRGEWSNGRTTAQYLNANADPPGQSGEGLTLSGSIGRYGSGTAKWPTGLDNPRVSAGGIGRGHESHPVMSNNVSMLQTRGLEKGGGISERSFSSGKNNEPLSRSVAEIRKPVWERGVRVVRGIQRLRESIAADGDSLGLGLGLEFQVGGDEGHRRARASTPSGRSGNSSLQTIARDRGPPPMSTAKGSITQAASAADYSADGEITLDEDPGGPGMESMAGSTRGGKAAEIQPVATRRNESTNYIGSEMVRESHAWRGADRRLDNRGPTGVVVGRDPGSNRWGELRRDSAESPGTLEINRSGAREFGDTYPIRHGSNSFQGGPESGLHRGAEMWSDKDGGIGVDI